MILRRFFGGSPNTSGEGPIDAVHAAANAQRGAQPSPALADALNAVAALPDEERERAVSAMVEMLGDISSPTGAGFLAVGLGARVEAGSDPLLTVQPIIDAMIKWMATVETAPIDDEEAVDPAPDPEAIQGLAYFGNALVAHLARLSPETRSKYAETPQFVPELMRIEHLCNGAIWILQLLRQRSGELVVLNVKEKAGARVKYQNVATNFHLFTLLQGALAQVMPDARTINQPMLDAALGGAYFDGHDEAWWHFGQPTVPEANIAASVWGEGSPDDIFRIEGHQVILLWPPLLGSRTWNSGFFGPALDAAPSSVQLTSMLSPDEVEEWWDKLSLRGTF